MYTRLRTAIWLALIIGGGLMVLVVWIEGDTISAVFASILAIALLTAWGAFSGWFWGLKRRVVKHTGRSIDNLTFVKKDIGTSRSADYVRALEHCAEQQSSLPFGTTPYTDLTHLKAGNLALQNIDWETVEAEDGCLINVPQNTVYLLKCEGTPFVARISENQTATVYEHEEAVTTGKGSRLQICAHSLDEANRVTRWLNELTGFNSIYRCQMLQVASPQDGSIGQTIRITKRPSETRDRIILSDVIIDVLERLIQSRLQHKDQLAKYGHSSNLGVLMHGPPGTGKTLMIRYLISRCQEHTVIVPTDMAVETLREAFRLGQYLQPAIMVLEDVDLLAQQRQTSRSVDGLQELMNQLDGLSTASDTIVLMTTNRPDVLEPALASRPGRVSQAIEFPLPDSEAREQLFKLFLQQAGTTLDVAVWSERTTGASPAFLQELCKRAILVATEREDIDPASNISVSDDDMNDAIHELVVLGGELTKTSLGFPTT